MIDQQKINEQMQMMVFVLEYYEQKIESGIITFRFDDAQENVILVHAMKDSVGNASKPLEIPFSLFGVDSLILQADYNVKQAELELLAAQEKVEREKRISAAPALKVLREHIAEQFAKRGQ